MDLNFYRMSKPTVTLDVREDIRKGREPFEKIIQTVAAVQPGEKLLLRAPFEPRPLMHLLAQRGFSNQTRQLGTGDWEVLFIRSSDAQAETTPASSQSPCGCNRAHPLEVDARGLEPPQPLVKILEALPTIPQGGRLRARTDRRPMHLFAQLADRGFTGESEEQKDGSFITTIRRN